MRLLAAIAVFLSVAMGGTLPCAHAAAGHPAAHADKDAAAPCHGDVGHDEMGRGEAGHGGAEMAAGMSGGADAPAAPRRPANDAAPRRPANDAAPRRPANDDDGCCEGGLSCEGCVAVAAVVSPPPALAAAPLAPPRAAAAPPAPSAAPPAFEPPPPRA